MKIVITKTNTPWGARWTRLGNVYKHVVNFPTGKKDEFINDQLFGGLDYKTLFNNLPEHGRVDIDETTVNFTIDMEQYTNGKLGYTKTQRELMNSDTAILYDGVRYYAYIIRFQGKSSAGGLNFTGEIDLFFTYADEFKFKGQNLIGRKHVDRMNADGTLKFDDMYESEGIVSSQPNYIYHAQDIEEAVSVKYDDDIYNDKMKVNWALVYLKKKGVDFSTYDINPYLMTQKMAYNIAIYPIILNRGDNWGKTRLNPLKLVMDNGDEHNLLDLDKMAEDEAVLSIHILPYLPLDAAVNIKRISKDKIYTNLTWRPQHEPADDDFPLMAQYDIKGQYYLMIKRVDDLPKYLFTKIPDAKINPLTDLSFNNKKSIKLESKMRTQPYTNVNFLHTLAASPQYDWTKITSEFIYIYYSFQPEKFVYSLICREEGAENRLLLKGTQFNNTMEWPLSTDAYDTYITNNRASAFAGVARDGILGLGIGGAVGKRTVGPVANAAQSALYNRINQETTPSARALVTKVLNPEKTSIAAGIAGATLAGAAGFAITGFSTLTEHADAARQPNNYKSPQSPILTSFLNDNNQNQFKLSFTSYHPTIRQGIYDFFYVNGYNYGKFNNINDIMNTRYYFNFIQTGNVYETLDTNLVISTRQKELINLSFENGLTIWHYRDKNTWKGIMNYEYENLEMVVVNNG